MVKVQDTQIKNIGFNTSADTGTKVRSGGEYLAKIVTGAIGAKKSLEHEQAKVEQAETKESNLLFNDLKIDAQKRKNEYDFQDPNNPTSSELMDLYDQTTEGQKEVYGMLHERDRQAYDLYYAQRDGDVKNLIGKEAKVSALTLTQQSLPNFRNEEHIDRWVESMEGMVSKKELFEVAGKHAESLLTAGALDNMTSQQLDVALPYMKYIKDPAIGGKFRKHMIDTMNNEKFEAAILGGSDSDKAHREAYGDKKGTGGSGSSKGSSGSGKKMTQALGDKLFASGQDEKALDIASKHGVKLTTLENIGDTIISTSKADIATSVEKYQLYNKYRNAYSFDPTTRKQIEGMEIVASVNGFDMNTEEGLNGTIHLYETIQEQMKNAKKPTILTADKIIEEVDPTGFNWMHGMSDVEDKYITPRVNEILPYVSGDVKKAYNIASAEFEDFSNKPWYAVGGSGSMFGEDAPIGLIFKNTPMQDDDMQEEAFELMKQQISPKSNGDELEVEYMGGDVWSFKDDKGLKHVRTSAQLQKDYKDRAEFKDAMKSVDLIAEKSDILHGDRLRDKQTNQDSITMKREIKTHTEKFEATLGRKITDKEKLEVDDKIIKAIKYRMVEQDYLAKKNQTRRLNGEEELPDKHGFKTSIVQKGLVNQGSLDVNSLIAVVNNEDGSVSTVKTIGVNIDGLETVIPTVHKDGHIMSEKEAVEHFKKTGENFGQFNSVEDATRFSLSLHDRQKEVYDKQVEEAKRMEFNKKYLKTKPNASNGELIAAYNESREFMTEDTIKERDGNERYSGSTTFFDMVNSALESTTKDGKMIDKATNKEIMESFIDSPKKGDSVESIKKKQKLIGLTGKDVDGVWGMRSKAMLDQHNGISTYSVKDSKDFVAQVQPEAERIANKIGSNIKPHWLVTMWRHETENGKSGVTMNTFNLGNMKAQSGYAGDKFDAGMVWEDDAEGNATTEKAAFRKYKSFGESADDFVKFLSTPRYAKARAAKTKYQFFSELKKAGYATDSEYVQKMMSFNNKG